MVFLKMICKICFWKLLKRIDLKIHLIVVCRELIKLIFSTAKSLGVAV